MFNTKPYDGYYPLCVYVDVRIVSDRVINSNRIHELRVRRVIHLSTPYSWNQWHFYLETKTAGRFRTKQEHGIKFSCVSPRCMRRSVCVYNSYFFRNLIYLSFVTIKVQKQLRTSRKFQYTHFPCHDTCQGYSKSVDIQSFGPPSSFFLPMSVQILVLRLCASVGADMITLGSIMKRKALTHLNSQYGVPTTTQNSLSSSAPHPESFLNSSWQTQCETDCTTTSSLV